MRYLGMLLLAAFAVLPSEGQEFGVAPSHIAESPAELLKYPEKWRSVWESLALFKIYDAQLSGKTWAKPVEPKLLVTFLQKTGLRLGVEYGDRFGHFREDAGRRVAEDILRVIQPIYEAGGTVSSLHFDGAVVRMLSGVRSGPNGDSGEGRFDLKTAAHVVADVFAHIRRSRPEIRIGLIVNIMNYDWSATVPGALGRWTAESGVYYQEVLAAVCAELKKNGDRLDFLEVDAPFNYYELKKSPTTGKPFHGDRLLRTIRDWCRVHDVAFHLVVNCEPREPFGDYPPAMSPEEAAAGATRYRQGGLAYLAALEQAAIRPDLILFQSWYRAPARNLPLSDPDSFIGTVRCFLQSPALLSVPPRH